MAKTKHTDICRKRTAIEMREQKRQFRHNNPACPKCKSRKCEGHKEEE